MTTLDRYLLARHLGALARALITLLCLYILIDLLTQRRDAILRYDVPWNAIFRYYAAMTPEILYRVAPLSMLVAVLLVLGDAAQNNEVTAALACGISLKRLVWMPAALGIALAVAAFVMEEGVGAKAARTAMDLQKSYFSRNPEAGNREGMSWANLSGDWTCHIMKFNSIALTGEDVLIHAIRPDAVEQIVARRIYWDSDRRQWILEDGHRYLFGPEARERREAMRITQQPAPFQVPPEELFALREPPETKTAKQLAADIRRAEARGAREPGLWVDYHVKFSQPALCFVMVGLAVPFALRIRRGGLAIGFGASIVIAIAYLIVYAVGIWLGDVGRLSPAVAAWFANAVFFCLGAALFARTPT